MVDFDPGAKFGKFPVWVWGIFVAVAGLAVYWVYARRTNTSSNNVTTATLDPNGYQTAGIQGGSAGGNNSIVSSDNNQAWLSRASKAVADTLQVSPSSVYAALQKWLSGQDITITEKSWVDKALQISGNPPESIQGTSTVKPDPTTGNTGNTSEKTLTSLTRAVESLNGTVYAHWSDGSTTWVSGADLPKLAAQRPITWVIGGPNGSPVVKWGINNRGTVYAYTADGKTAWVSNSVFNDARPQTVPI